LLKQVCENNSCPETAKAHFGKIVADVEQMPPEAKTILEQIKLPVAGA
jgi:hypothetical protein